MTKMRTFKKTFSFALCVILTFQNIFLPVQVFAETKNGGTNTITVKEDKTKVELQDVELYVGETFDPDSPLKNVTDKDGNKLQAKDIEWYYIDDVTTKILDTSKPGIYKVRIVYLDGTGKFKYSETNTITVKEDKTKVELQDVELYAGETFDPDSPLKNVTDKDGNRLQAKDIKWYYIDEVVTKILDTSKPGIHKVRIVYLDGTGKFKYSGIKMITVKDKTKLELQDVELYVGEIFDPDTPLKNVTDKDGNKLQAKDIEWYYIDEMTTKVLDTSKPGIHKVRIAYLDGTGRWKYSETNSITVKEDKTKLELQDVELYVGEIFDPDSPFKNVTDKDGNKLSAKDVRYYYINGSDGNKVDTSKPEKYTVQVFIRNVTNTDWVRSNVATVTVKKIPVLTAELISQEAILGETISKFDLKKSVKNVKLDDKVLSPKDYTIKSANGLFSIRGSRTWDATITTTDGKYSLKVKLPFNVKWGSSILLKGYGDNSIGAITLHQKDGSNLELTDRVGVTRDSNIEEIHFNFTNKTYYDIRLLGVPTTSQYLTSLKPLTKRNSLTWGQGNDNAQDKINDFGDNSNGIQKANVGDILEVTHEEAKSRERLIVNEKEIQANNGQKMVYYELTKDGFSPVRVNQLKMRDEISTNLHINEEELDKDLKANPSKYYENPNKYNNLNLVGFVKYPDTSKSGKQPATIRFEETLKSGKKVQYDYDFQINVNNKWVNVTIPTKMLFFSDMESAKKDKVISESYSITNNSDNTSLDIVMASFSVAKDSEVTFLSAADAPPATSENKLRLNLLVNGQTKVQGLTNETKPIHLVDLNVKKSAKLTFEGEYFNANSESSSKAKSSMVLKFNIKK